MAVIVSKQIVVPPPRSAKVVIDTEYGGSGAVSLATAKIGDTSYTPTAGEKKHYDLTVTLGTPFSVSVTRGNPSPAAVCELKWTHADTGEVETWTIPYTLSGVVDKNMEIYLKVGMINNGAYPGGQAHVTW